MELSERMAKLGRACRHYDPIGGIRDNADCRIGHPIRKIVTNANGGDDTGLAFMLPCRPGPDRKADCPSYDPRSDAEMAEIAAQCESRVTEFVEALPEITAIRAALMVSIEPCGDFACPFCGLVGTFRATIARGYNDHMSGQCSSCEKGFIE
jgi:hypothetical protein